MRIHILLPESQLVGSTAIDPFTTIYSRLRKEPELYFVQLTAKMHKSIICGENLLIWEAETNENCAYYCVYSEGLNIE